ncbi:MAG: hypothetical protein IJQ58_02510, partial [Synergistaceae bacterium]|nr:hypothetical protein [Synergistaceae bacterium]
LSLFDSSLTGEGGRQWGNYLRSTWGGASALLILFALYLCLAKLMKFKIPRFRRQFFGTLMLYVSFAFLLGLLKETGWNSERILFMPGAFGSGLAKFFTLNVGTFITLLLVIGSFMISAVFFGSRLLSLSLPSLPKWRFKGFPRRTSHRNERGKLLRRDDPRNYTPPAPSIPVPNLKPAPRERSDDSLPEIPTEESQPIINFQMPKFKPAPEPPKQQGSKAVEIIDNALAMIDAGELKAPAPKKRTDNLQRTKKIRRPLPAINLTPPEEAEDESADDEAIFPPPVDIFGPKAKFEPDKDILRNSEKQAKTITATLKTFNVSATVSHIITGASAVQYQLELSPGTKVSKIAGLADELAMSLAVTSVRIEAPILGTHYVGIEVPCADRKIIPLRNIIDSPEFQENSARLPLPLGVMIDGKILVIGLENMPHLLVAGEKDSGLSTFLNACILGMCCKRLPDEMNMILIDPRHIEFAVYDGMPHLLASPVYDASEALKALLWAYNEMEKRTAAFAAAKVKNIAAFNRKNNKSRLPEIVIVINELSDLLYGAGNEIENVIMRLAQKSGAAGIYMIIASQRPSPDVFTTMIKSNISARVAFKLSAENESRNVIGNSDAMRLTGKGDMLFRNTGSPQPVRLQAP